MTITELILSLEIERRKANDYDNSWPAREQAHKSAENLLLRFINNEEVYEIFENMDKWYA